MSRLNALDRVVLNSEQALLGRPLDREAIHDQLERILAHPHFKHSKRYPNLFRYIVERTLQGDSHLKERTLGVEVFGRDPNYDTNEDPVVRITASEIRKRIAQYYHEPGHEAELRIDLPAGSYVPEFHLPAQTPVADADQAATQVAAAYDAPLLGVIGKRSLLYLVLLILAAAAAVGTARVKAWVTPRPIDDFWAPVLDSPAPSLVCIGEPKSLQKQTAPPGFTVSDHIYRGDSIAFSDANALFRLAVLLGGRGKPARLQTSTATTLTDLRQGPVVLIAGLDNEWTVRLATPLRYHFGYNTAHSFWIEDRENPSGRNWIVDFTQRYSDLTQDYAIVSRFSDPTTGQPVVIAAGLGENGTIAAGEFLTDAREMDDAAKSAPRNGRGQNVEFVIATQVIDEKSGRPRVLASYYW
jgi:hypothetical protein